jgi:hypothetical protein
MKLAPLLRTRILAGCLLLPLTGCGGVSDEPALLGVSGKVTLDGKPLETGTVLFVPLDGKGRADAGPVVKGEYRLKCTPGEKRVEISSQVEADKPAADGLPDYKSLIPAKYNRATTLTATVKSTGENAIDFAVTSK